jgi:hypothetical protein
LLKWSPTEPGIYKRLSSPTALSSSGISGKYWELSFEPGQILAALVAEFRTTGGKYLVGGSCILQYFTLKTKKTLNSYKSAGLSQETVHSQNQLRQGQRQPETIWKGNRLLPFLFLLSDDATFSLVSF